MSVSADARWPIVVHTSSLHAGRRPVPGFGFAEVMWKAAVHRSPPLRSLPFGSCCQMFLWSDPDMKSAPASKSNALPDVRSAFPKAEFTHCLHSPSWGGLECTCLASTLGNQNLWGGAWDSAF